MFLKALGKKVRGRFCFATVRSPLDLKLFTEEKIPLVKSSLQKRGRDPKLAEDTAQLLARYRGQLFGLEGKNKEVNAIGREIGSMIKEKSKKKEKSQESESNVENVIEEKKKVLETQKQSQKTMEKELNETREKLENNLLKIGNIVSEYAAIGNDEKDNIVMYEYPSKGETNLSVQLKRHEKSYTDICEELELTDLTRGQKVSGHRGYFLKNEGVLLALGLAHYGIQFLNKKQFTIYQTPAIITEEALKGSCQLQELIEDIYTLPSPPSYLIATSEQSLASYYKGENLSVEKMDIRMGGYSSCFRREAGAHGREIKGLFRVHQFEKVEQFAITTPESSHKMFLEFVENCKEFYMSLGIPFRIVNIVSGELNNAASYKYDLEGWFPEQGRWRELVSISNCTDYQSRLLQTKISPGQIYPHMLNGTLVAIQRTLCCLVENYWDQNKGIVKVPEVLKPYVGVEEIGKKK